MQQNSRCFLCHVILFFLNPEIQQWLKMIWNEEGGSHIRLPRICFLSINNLRDAGFHSKFYYTDAFAAKFTSCVEGSRGLPLTVWTQPSMLFYTINVVCKLTSTTPLSYKDRSSKHLYRQSVKRQKHLHLIINKTNIPKSHMGCYSRKTKLYWHTYHVSN